MIVKVRNAGNVQLAVSIINRKTREIRKVMIQSKSGVTLPKDYIVEPNYFTKNKAALRIIQKD